MTYGALKLVRVFLLASTASLWILALSHARATADRICDCCMRKDPLHQPPPAFPVSIRALAGRLLSAQGWHAGAGVRSGGPVSGAAAKCNGVPDVPQHLTGDKAPGIASLFPPSLAPFLSCSSSFLLHTLPLLCPAPFLVS